MGMVKAAILVPPRMRGAARPTLTENKPVAMNCPICKDVRLTETTLADGLPATTCGQCKGWWIDATNYWKWLETRPEKAQANAGDKAGDLSAQRPVKDSGPGKFCPRCGRFLARAKPGRGLDFFVNRCGGC